MFTMAAFAIGLIGDASAEASLTPLLNDAAPLVRGRAAEALGSIGASAILQIMGKKNASLFVGDWVAPLLLFGVYNKIVKVQGSDRQH